MVHFKRYPLYLIFVNLLVLEQYFFLLPNVCTSSWFPLIHKFPYHATYLLPHDHWWNKMGPAAGPFGIPAWATWWELWTKNGHSRADLWNPKSALNMRLLIVLKKKKVATSVRGTSQTLRALGFQLLPKFYCFSLFISRLELTFVQFSTIPHENHCKF